MPCACHAFADRDQERRVVVVTESGRQRQNKQGSEGERGMKREKGTPNEVAIANHGWKDLPPPVLELPNPPEVPKPPLWLFEPKPPPLPKPKDMLA